LNAKARASQHFVTPQFIPSRARPPHLHGLVNASDYTDATIIWYPWTCSDIVAAMSSNKRGNIFGQGKPERPYEERDNEPADVPQRATAAQLASRK
jgi:hypothetical protein